MPMSTEVNLPRAHVARYPQRCVVCNKENPPSFARIITSSIGWWLLLLWWWWGWLKPFRTRVPACSGCAWKLHARRYGGLIAILVIAVLAMIYLVPRLDSDLPRIGKKYLAVGVIILCAAPFIIVSVFFPPAFDVTVYSSSVDYEFADIDYAYDFAELNADADWVKVDGEAFESR